MRENLKKGKQIWELPYFHDQFDEDNDSSDDEDEEEKSAEPKPGRKLEWMIA